MSAPFPPTRAEGLRRLAAFVPRAGRAYAETRNHDHGPERRENVSALSPYLRYRLIGEREVVAAVLERHSPQAVEKFVQEVYWRTYWKGWMEMRPALWQAYEAQRDADLDLRGGAAKAYEAALDGRTGLDAFDHWVRELQETGYLHNHARMWFASIWLFTLKLPWTLGADLFLRQLVDGDAAVNTLSWRWVAGLQTKGKTYLATPDNIARYAGGRFAPEGLATRADPLTEAEPVPEPMPLSEAITRGPARNVLLLLHEDDLGLETLDLGDARVKGAALMRRTRTRSPLEIGGPVEAFAAGALADTGARAREAFGLDAVTEAVPDAETLIAAAQRCGADTILYPEAPVGPVRVALDGFRGDVEAAGLDLVPLRRPWDAAAWPHATKGFFRLKQQIPALLHAEGLAPKPSPPRGKAMRKGRRQGG
ncbi:MAG: FAD-binding domain-containing protein [Pseudomonadota bacterium]